MINRPTTLILGAGASVPFGFPTGYNLLQSVLSLATLSDFSPSPLLRIGHNRRQINEFKEALQKSGKGSVDSFLEHRPEFIDVGKKFMALALIQCESEDPLFARNGNNWYEYLFQQLSTQFNDFGNNKLSILTFNYDRSLEHYLFTTLNYAYGRPVGECATMLKSIRIVHLHGDLGGLPLMSNERVRPYSNQINDENLIIAANRIKIIHEDVAGDPQFELARQLLSASEMVCFLGFGYHKLNMERLGFSRSDSYRGTRYRSILGSTYQMTGEECKHYSSPYGFNLRPSRFDYRALDVLAFVRETGILFND